MKRELIVGDKITYSRRVGEEDVAAFHGEVVHPVYSTFALARDAEYTTRQFILNIIEEDEEGIGTSLSINHVNSAFIGEEVLFTGEVLLFQKGRLDCSWEAFVGERRIAFGKTGQKLLKKAAVERLFKSKRTDGKE